MEIVSKESGFFDKSWSDYRYSLEWKSTKAVNLDCFSDI